MQGVDRRESESCSERALGQRVASSRRLRDLRISRISPSLPLVLSAFNRVPRCVAVVDTALVREAVSVGATPNESESSQPKGRKSAERANSVEPAAPSPPSTTIPATQSDGRDIPASCESDVLLPTRRLPFSLTGVSKFALHPSTRQSSRAR